MSQCSQSQTLCEMPKGILTDTEIEQTVYKSQKDYPEHLRPPKFHSIYFLLAE